MYLETMYSSYENPNHYSHPLVTIITPTYNSNSVYLRNAIQSVLSQTYLHVEYIIIDDGSNNFPETEVKELLSSKKSETFTWKILRQEQNIGTVKNMNYAVKVANGKYIVGLAHDDSFYDESVISDLVREFQNSNALLITAQKKDWDPLLKKEGEITPTKEKIQYLREFPPKVLYGSLLEDNFVYGASTAYSTECFMKYGFFDEKYRYLEDWPYVLKLSRRGVGIHFWNRIVIRYSVRGISTHPTNIRFMKEDLRCRREHLLYFLLHPLSGYAINSRQYLSFLKHALKNYLYRAKTLMKAQSSRK